MVERPGALDAEPAIGPEINPPPELAADGSFDIDQLPAGTYLVVFDGCFCDGNAIWYYPQAPDPGHATRITVNTGQTVSIGVVAGERWGAVSGRVTRGGAPVGGAVVVPAMTEPDGSLYTAPGTTTASDGSFDDGTVTPGSWRMLATDPLGVQVFSPTLTVGAGTTVAGVSIALPTFQTPMPPPPIVRLLSAHARLTGGVLSLTARFSDPASGSVALWFTGRRRRRVLIYRVERRFVLRDGKVRLTITLPRRYRALASPTAHLALLDPADSARSFAIHVADSTGRSPRAHR